MLPHLFRRAYPPDSLANCFFLISLVKRSQKSAKHLLSFWLLDTTRERAVAAAGLDNHASPFIFYDVNLDVRVMLSTLQSRYIL